MNALLRPAWLVLALLAAVPADAQNLVSTGASSGLRLFMTNGNDFWLDPTSGALVFKVNGNAVSTMTPQGFWDVGAGSIETSELAANAVTQAGQATANDGQSTASAAWVDMPGMSVSQATAGGPLLLSFTTQVTNDTGGSLCGFRFTIDGTPVTSAPWGNAMMQNAPGVATYQQNLAMTWLATGVSAAAHTVKVQWKAGGGTCIGPEAAEASDRTLVVVELKR